jgi:hypothetical protein
MTTTAALECMSNRLVDILPGVNFEDIFWTTSAITSTQGIWNHQETVYYQFDVNFVPQNVLFYGMPNAAVTYNGLPVNWQITDPSKEDDRVNQGWNGVYSQDKNCRDCFPSSDVVYLRFKDLIAEDVTSGKFLKNLQDDCAEIFESTNYAYASFSESAAVTEGAIPPRPDHDLHLEYVWFLMFLLVPAAWFLYTRVYKAQAGGNFLSAYDVDREAEMVAATNEEQA